VLQIDMAIAEIAFRKDLSGEILLFPAYATVLNPRLRLANGRIDPNGVVAILLADQLSAFIEHEAALKASEVRELRLLYTHFHGL
jgi:hypothetical protein